MGEGGEEKYPHRLLGVGVQQLQEVHQQMKGDGMDLRTVLEGDDAGDLRCEVKMVSHYEELESSLLNLRLTSPQTSLKPCQKKENE